MPDEFLCDVHISYKIVSHLQALGFGGIHVNEILNKSETKDAEICRYADELDLVVLTKDSDFRNSFLIKKSPRKLVKINLGNISNQALAEIFTNNRSVIENLKSKETFLLEIGNNSLYLLEP